MWLQNLHSNHVRGSLFIRLLFTKSSFIKRPYIRLLHFLSEGPTFRGSTSRSSTTYTILLHSSQVEPRVPPFQVSCSCAFSLVEHQELSRIFTAYFASHSGVFQIEKHWNRHIVSKSISVQIVCFCILFDWNIVFTSFNS